MLLFFSCSFHNLTSWLLIFVCVVQMRRDVFRSIYTAAPIILQVMSFCTLFQKKERSVVASRFSFDLYQRNVKKRKETGNRNTQGLRWKCESVKAAGLQKKEEEQNYNPKWKKIQAAIDLSTIKLCSFTVVNGMRIREFVCVCAFWCGITCWTLWIAKRVKCGTKSKNERRSKEGKRKNYDIEQWRWREREREKNEYL